MGSRDLRNVIISTLPIEQGEGVLSYESILCVNAFPFETGSRGQSKWKGVTEIPSYIFARLLYLYGKANLADV